MERVAEIFDDTLRKIRFTVVRRVKGEQRFQIERLSNAENGDECVESLLHRSTS
jgi:hypothetical protein